MPGEPWRTVALVKADKAAAELWDAINAYVAACQQPGDPFAHGSEKLITHGAVANAIWLLRNAVLLDVIAARDAAEKEAF
jgi:hypothetical protein